LWGGARAARRGIFSRTEPVGGLGISAYSWGALKKAGREQSTSSPRGARKSSGDGCDTILGQITGKEDSNETAPGGEGDGKEIKKKSGKVSGKREKKEKSENWRAESETYIKIVQEKR